MDRREAEKQYWKCAKRQKNAQRHARNTTVYVKKAEASSRASLFFFTARKKSYKKWSKTCIKKDAKMCIKCAKMRKQKVRKLTCPCLLLLSSSARQITGFQSSSPSSPSSPSPLSWRTWQSSSSTSCWEKQREGFQDALATFLRIMRPFCDFFF